MIIKECVGYELEKEQSNTSEDFFNRSEVKYIEGGIEKQLHVLYVRFFDEKMNEFTPYDADPIFQIKEAAVYLRDVVALMCLLKNPGLRHRKRLYINLQKDYQFYFQDIDFTKIKQLMIELKEKNQVEVKSPLDFILQAK